MSQDLRNYRRILELAENDPEYHVLEQRFRQLAEGLDDLFTRLPEPDRDLIVHYLGFYGEMNVRLLELACMSMKFPDQAETTAQA